MARNFSVVAREYLRLHPRWVLGPLAAHLAYAVVMAKMEDDRLLKLANLARGVMDGLAGRMGRHPTGQRRS